MNKYDVISIFPDYLKPLELSLIGKARESKIIEINIHDLRQYATGVHKSVDDTPYGGGAGMVMSPDPWGQAIDKAASSNSSKEHELIVLTPAGQTLDQDLVEELSEAEHLIFACGRYEGIDQRVTEHYRAQNNFKVREISIGNYVLGGGEVAALVILEAVIRLLPGVLGNPDSIIEESHSLSNEEGKLVEYPNYTKPAEWRGLKVPEILLSGNHGEILKWRREQALKRTRDLEK
jgi:tRNA (guanine37-N1)-methyltransferase